MKTANYGVALNIQLSRSTQSGTLTEQIYGVLRDAICDGTLRPGDRLPPTRFLAQQLEVGRNTVVHAYQKLIEEGFAASTVGEGTRVVESLSSRAVVPQAASRAAGAPPVRSLNPRARLAEAVLEDVIQAERPFAVVSPDLDSLPGKKWVQVVTRCQKIPWRHNGYSAPEGIAGFREAVADNLKKTRGIFCSADQVVATSNIQQGLALCLEILLAPGSRIAVENPGYSTQRRTVAYYGHTPVPVPVDEEGIRIEALESLDVSAVLVTPAHQYPMGGCLSPARRADLLAWAKRRGVWILEDDYDGEVCLATVPTPALAALDQGLESVIYLGTFTKSIYPGFKLGFMVVPAGLAGAFAGARFLSDRQCCENHEVVLKEFILGGWYDSHRRRIVKLYRERRSALIAALTRTLGDLGTVLAGDFGTHLVFVLHDEVDDVGLSRFLRKKHRLETRPLSPCWAEGVPKRGLILGFAGFSVEIIAESVEKLAQGVRAWLTK